MEASTSFTDALVIKSTGSWYQVRLADGRVVDSRIKGKFRTKGLTTTNPVAVGDRVDLEMENNQQTAVITKLHDRKNYIIRKSINLSKQVQIIAANLDQAFLIVTLASPPTSLGFIDRFLVTAEAYSIPVILVFNKLDLFSDEGLEILTEYTTLYEHIGYTCITISALSGTNVSTLVEKLTDKITLIAGHSGVGKSTAINQIIPGLSQKTGAISEWSDKGKHTTTFAEMFELPNGGFIIDTPGIRELGVVDIEKEELGHFFPEFRDRLNQCRFHNCQHINEPGCAIIKAVEDGAIHESRYLSYLSIYEGNDRASLKKGL